MCKMWLPDGLFDRTVRPAICSLSPHEIVCVNEEKGDVLETMSKRCSYFVNLRDRRTPPLVKRRLKAREERLCLDRGRALPITTSAAPVHF